MKNIINPRILENMLTSGYFPHVTGWQVAMLRRWNQKKSPLTPWIILWSFGTCLTRGSRLDMEGIRNQVVNTCNSFKDTFGVDPLSLTRKYENMVEHAKTILDRLAVTIVEQEEMLKSMRLAPHSEVTVAYRSQFRITYNCAARLFGDDLSKEGFKPFFDRAEGIVTARKN